MSETNRLLRFGCFGCAGSALVFFVLIILGLIDADDLARHGGEEPGWEYEKLPKPIQTTEILFSASEAGFLEGCGYAEYRLSPATVQAIRQQGALFFQNMPQPPHSNTHFKAWRETPSREALRGPSPCGEEAFKHHGNAPIVRVDMQSPGSFYSVTENGEGIIVVDPWQGTAVFSYQG